MITDRSREGSTPVRFLEFFLTRNIGTLADTAVLWLFADLVFKGSYVGENIISPTISFEVATFVNYVTSYFWIYNNRIEKRSTKLFFQRFVTFNFSSVLGFLIKMVLLLLFKHWLGWHVVLCNLLALTVSGLFNFTFADQWVFGKKMPRPAREVLSREELGEMSPVFQGRFGQWLAGIAMKIVGVDKLNRLYDSAADSEGAAFAGRIIEELGCDCLVGNAERLENLPEGAFITISNHPYGALDGIMLTDLIGSRRPDFKVMVNDILSRVKPLASSFITVNPKTDANKVTDKQKKSKRAKGENSVGNNIKRKKAGAECAKEKKPIAEKETSTKTDAQAVPKPTFADAQAVSKPTLADAQAVSKPTKTDAQAVSKPTITATNLAGIRSVMSHLSDDHPMGFFPSGAVSDYHPREHDISDREWQESMVRLIQKAKVPVVPVRFFDHNSKFFYFLGLLSWKIRVLRLPREIFWQKGRPQRIAVGETISVETISSCQSVDELRHLLRSSVYDMPMPATFTSRHDLMAE